MKFVKPEIIATAADKSNKHFGPFNIEGAIRFSERNPNSSPAPDPCSEILDAVWMLAQKSSIPNRRLIRLLRHPHKSRCVFALVLKGSPAGCASNLEECRSHRTIAVHLLGGADACT
jgi:hypothetical protein